MTTRKSKENWLKAGLNTLADIGESGIRIELLCNRLGVSKGSFYHHFENIDTYIHALMQYWEQENTNSIIEEAEKTEVLEQKTEKLNSLVINKKQQVEVMIRSWAVRDNRIISYINKVDGLRVEYLKKLYMEHGLPADKALLYAKIEYCAFVGGQHLYKDSSPEELSELSNTFQQIIKKSIL